MWLLGIYPAIFIAGGLFFGSLAVIAIATAGDGKDEGDESEEEG